MRGAKEIFETPLHMKFLTRYYKVEEIKEVTIWKQFQFVVSESISGCNRRFHRGNDVKLELSITSYTYRRQKRHATAVTIKNTDGYDKNKSAAFVRTICPYVRYSKQTLANLANLTESRRYAEYSHYPDFSLSSLCEN